MIEPSRLTPPQKRIVLLLSMPIARTRLPGKAGALLDRNGARFD